MTAYRADSSLTVVRRGGPAALLTLLVAGLHLAACGDSSAPGKPAAPAEAGREKGSDSASRRDAPPVAEAESARFANAVATSKGGAAVDLLYDIAARPVAGQPIEVELVFEPRSAADALEVEVSAVPGVTVVNPGQARFAPVASGERHTTRVSLSADADGLYYLNVIVRMVSKVQTDARTFSVPLVVGDSSTEATASEKPAATPAPAGDEAVKSLPAAERTTAQ